MDWYDPQRVDPDTDLLTFDAKNGDGALEDQIERKEKGEQDFYMKGGIDEVQAS